MVSDKTFELKKRDKPIRIISTSDWHLGHKRVPTVNLCNRLRTYLFPKLKECDLLNIGGDVWDTLLSLCEDTNIIEAFLIDLLRVCHENNIIVRVLLGTYSHDRNQSTLFCILQEKCRFTNDLFYVDKVYLEEIKALQLRILYLPDDLPYSSSYDCMSVIESMMEARGWKYVDYVFGHGYFDHMLPTHIPRKPKCTFHVEQFSSFVSKYVCMGHIHQCDYTENVFYNNSFDRLAHGEEDPKGFMYIIDYGDEAKLEFVENRDAEKFITIDMSMYNNKDEIGQIYLNRLEKAFGCSPGYVRLSHASSEVIKALHSLTSNKFPQLSFSFKKSLDTRAIDTTQVHKKLLDVKSYPIPNENTLPEMVYAFIGGDKQSLLSKERISDILATK